MDIWECRLPFDPNIQDVSGQTPLYVACLLGNTQLVQVLLGWKVKFMKTDRSDVTVLGSCHCISYWLLSIICFIECDGK